MLSNRLIKSSNFNQINKKVPNFWIWRDIQCEYPSRRHAHNKILYQRNAKPEAPKMCKEKYIGDYRFLAKVMTFQPTHKCGIKTQFSVYIQIQE